MNERTQTRLAWAFSAALLTAGWLSRYLQDPGEDHPLSCADATPRAVALVVGGDEFEPESGDRVYVYWLNPSGAAKGRGATGDDATGAPSAEASAPESWSFAGSAVLGEASGPPLGTSQIPNLSPAPLRP